MKHDSRPDTAKHIERVRELLKDVQDRLYDRGIQHDLSKLETPEVEVFDEYTYKLNYIQYGSPEYDECRQAMAAALEHHYAANSHHPEHYTNGTNGMSLLDLIEMLVDWKAASERHNRPPMPAAPGRPDAPKYDSSIARSIEINQKRFGYGDELKQILLNTAVELGFDEKVQTDD